MVENNQHNFTTHTLLFILFLSFLLSKKKKKYSHLVIYLICLNFIDDKNIFFPGHAQLQTRVLKGQNAANGEFPWMVSLRRDGVHFCGGAIISPR